MKLRDGLPDRKAVHVWLVELDPNVAALERCSKSLSSDERERASRFRFENLKNDFVLCRGVLRALLGRYLSIEADQIAFGHGPKGKPRLECPESPLRFNLSHSGRFAIYAFADGCEVGIDIEEIKRIPDQEDIARRFFSREECEEWLELDASQRDDGFFQCWTRKEAYIKALGDGLSMPLDGFRVSLRPGIPARLIHADGDSAAASRWWLCSLGPVAGYVGALAFPDQARDVAILPRLSAAAMLELVSGTEPFPPAAKELVCYFTPQSHT